MAERSGNEVASTASASGRISVVLSFSLAAMLAAAVGAAVWQLQDTLTRGLLYTGAVLALAGLFSIFAFMAGLVRFDRQNQTRVFFDGLTDAIGDACVVMDGKSRAIYGNAPFLKLTAAAGVGRLVGFDLLYAGQAAFVEPSISWRRRRLKGKATPGKSAFPPGPLRQAPAPRRRSG